MTYSTPPSTPFLPLSPYVGDPISMSPFESGRVYTEEENLINQLFHEKIPATPVETTKTESLDSITTEPSLDSMETLTKEEEEYFASLVFPTDETDAMDEMLSLPDLDLDFLASAFESDAIPLNLPADGAGKIEELTPAEIKKLNGSVKLELVKKLIGEGIPSNLEFIAKSAELYNKSGEIYATKFYWKNIRFGKQNGELLLYFEDNFDKRLIFSKHNATGSGVYDFLQFKAKNGNDTALARLLRSFQTSDQPSIIEDNIGISNALAGFIVFHLHWFLTESEYRIMDENLVLTYSIVFDLMFKGAVFINEIKIRGRELKNVVLRLLCLKTKEEIKSALSDPSFLLETEMLSGSQTQSPSLKRKKREDKLEGKNPLREKRGKQVGKKGETKKRNRIASTTHSTRTSPASANAFV